MSGRGKVRRALLAGFGLIATLAIPGAVGVEPPPWDAQLVAGQRDSDRAITAYSAFPPRLPQGYSSLGFQATGTSQFGDRVWLTQPGELHSFRVGMVSWACQEGSWTAGCVSAEGATFTHELTVNFYTVDLSGPVPVAGDLITSGTQVTRLPYRPSADPVNCPANPTQWYSEVDDACYNGFAHTVTFPASVFANLGPLPEHVIWTVAFNTTTYGNPPIGPNDCTGTPEGCPYDSLNVGASSFGSTQAFVGRDVVPDGVFVESTGPAYCSPVGGVNILRETVGCYVGNRPVGEINLAPGRSATALAALPNPAPAGGSLALSALVRCALEVEPDGIVLFLVDRTVWASSPVYPGGAALARVDHLPPGTHKLVAVYRGGNCADSASAPVKLTIEPHRPKVA